MNRFVLSFFVYLFVMLQSVAVFAQSDLARTAASSTWDKLVDALVPMVLSVIAVYLAKGIGQLLKIAFDWLAAKLHGTSFEATFNEARVIVTRLHDNAVKGIEKDAADGIITPEERKARLDQIKTDAVRELGGFVSKLPSMVQPYLQSKLGDIVEGALSSLKLERLIPSKGNLTPSAPPKA